MTVRELINKLLDKPKDREVLLYYEKEHIDERGEKCIGYCFDIDDVRKCNIMFTDWRDKKKTSRKIYDNLFEEIEKRQRRIQQLESKLNRIKSVCYLNEVERFERIKEICEEEEPTLNEMRKDYGLEPITELEPIIKTRKELINGNNRQTSIHD